MSSIFVVAADVALLSDGMEANSRTWIGSSHSCRSATTTANHMQAQERYSSIAIHLLLRLITTLMEMSSRFSVCFEIIMKTLSEAFLYTFLSRRIQPRNQRS